MVVWLMMTCGWWLCVALHCKPVAFNRAKLIHIQTSLCASNPSHNFYSSFASSAPDIRDGDDLNVWQAATYADFDDVGGGRLYIAKALIHTKTQSMLTRLAIATDRERLVSQGVKLLGACVNKELPAWKPGRSVCAICIYISFSKELKTVSMCASCCAQTRQWMWLKRI